jgi:hypothetical protein
MTRRFAGPIHVRRLRGDPLRYIIRPASLSQCHEIEINESRFRELSSVSLRDWQYLGLEEKFAVLFSNFEEFEQQVLTLSLSASLHLDLDWAKMSDARLQLTRRIVNLLTAARLYRDQVTGDLIRLQRAGAISGVDLPALWDRESSRSFGFRLVEELRNHFQHSSLPLGRIAYPSRNAGSTESPLFSFGLELSLDAAPLFGDRRFDQQIARQLEALHADENDMILFVRQYVEGLSRIHADVRLTIDADATACRAEIEAVRSEWGAVGGEVPMGLAAIKEADDRTWVEIAVVNLNASDRRLALVRSNRTMHNLSRRFVSSGRLPSLFPSIVRDA